MRIFVGGIHTETNTFSPVPNGLSDDQTGYRDNHQPVPIKPPLAGGSPEWLIHLSGVLLTITTNTYNAFIHDKLTEVQ